MQKTRTKKTSVRKTNALASEIIADLKEFADALESGIPLESKYMVRRVSAPTAPSKKR